MKTHTKVKRTLREIRGTFVEQPPIVKGAMWGLLSALITSQLDIGHKILMWTVFLPSFLEAQIIMYFGGADVWSLPAIAQYVVMFGATALSGSVIWTIADRIMQTRTMSDLLWWIDKRKKKIVRKLRWGKLEDWQKGAVAGTAIGSMQSVIVKYTVLLIPFQTVTMPFVAMSYGVSSTTPYSIMDTAGGVMSEAVSILLSAFMGAVFFGALVYAYTHRRNLRKTPAIMAVILTLMMAAMMPVSPLSPFAVYEYGYAKVYIKMQDGNPPCEEYNIYMSQATGTNDNWDFSCDTTNGVCQAGPFKTGEMVQLTASSKGGQCTAKVTGSMVMYAFAQTSTKTLTVTCSCGDQLCTTNPKEEKCSSGDVFECYYDSSYNTNRWRKMEDCGSGNCVCSDAYSCRCEYGVDCYTASDCEGKVHPMCVGYWTCTSNHCNWVCQATTTTPTTRPTTTTTRIEPACYNDAACGTSGDIGGYYCIGNKIAINHIEYKCANPGTGNAYCTSQQTTRDIATCLPETGVECVHGMSECQAITKCNNNGICEPNLGEGSTCSDCVNPCDDDGICDTENGENIQNCPNDCGFDWDKYLLMFAGIAVLGVGGYLYFKRKERKRA